MEMMEIMEGRIEPLIDTTHLRPSPLVRGLGFAAAAIGVGLGGALFCWGVSLVWPRAGVPSTAPVAPVATEPVKPESPRPAAPPSTTSKSNQGDPIDREVTVFLSIKYAAGNVVTGWIYKDGQETNPPKQQYCYYVEPAGNRLSTKVDLAVDGTEVAGIDKELVPNLEQAVAKCQWWHSDTRPISN